MTQELTLEQKYAILRAPIAILTHASHTWAGSSGASGHPLGINTGARQIRTPHVYEDNYARTREDK